MLVTFFLRNNKDAKRVMLAGSFNNWSPDVLANEANRQWMDCQCKPGPRKVLVQICCRWQLDH